MATPTAMPSRTIVPAARIERSSIGQPRSVCSRTCLTVVLPSPSRSSVRWAPSGAQPALGQEGSQVVVVGGRSHVTARVNRSATRVSTHGLQQPGAVPGAALVRVDGQVGELAVGDRVAVGVGGRVRSRTNPVTRLRSRATSTRLRASGGRPSERAPARGDLRRRPGRRAPRRAAARRTSSARRAPARRRSPAASSAQATRDETSAFTGPSNQPGSTPPSARLGPEPALDPAAPNSPCPRPGPPTGPRGRRSAPGR